MYRLIIILLIAASCQSRRATPLNSLDSLILVIPEIKPGYIHEATKEDPVSVSGVPRTFLDKHFDKFEGVVGYCRVDGVTCLLTTYPGDDIYLELTTFIEEKKIDSKMLAAVWGYVGCEYISVEHKLTMISSNKFESILKEVVQECDSITYDPIVGTEKTSTVATTTIIQSDGKISISTREL